MAEKEKLTGDPRRDFGWFSRRHETAERHLAAQTKWQAEHGSEAKLARVVERQTERAKREPVEQLFILDQRLGVDRGAIKERARLLALIQKGGQR